MEGTSSVSWCISVILAMALVIGGVVIFVIFISLGATAMQDNAKFYQQGSSEILAWMGQFLQETLPGDIWEGLDTKAQAYVVDAIPHIATSLLAFAEGMGLQMLLFLLYLCFWIFEPLPINNSVAQVFKAYFLLKTLVCLLFAGLMSIYIVLVCALFS